MPQETPLGTGETTFRAYAENNFDTSTFEESPTELWNGLPQTLKERWAKIEQAVIAAYEGDKQA